MAQHHLQSPRVALVPQELDGEGMAKPMRRRGPRSQREEAEAWLRSERAALWLSVLELPPDNIERALANFPEHRRRTSVSFDPAAARKAYQTRLKRGNWMKPGRG